MSSALVPVYYTDFSNSSSEEESVEEQEEEEDEGTGVVPWKGRRQVHRERRSDNERRQTRQSSKSEHQEILQGPPCSVM